ncbi:MAG: hypothetical protein RLP44_22685 [Aggregatilineales bacterium]
MLKLTKKCLIIFFAIFMLHLGIMYAMSPLVQDSYLAASIDKIALLQNHPDGSILLVGGSSVAFGYDSAYLQDSTGRTVINTGLHHGLGLRFTLNSILPYVQENDIVLLNLEYDHYLDSPDFKYSDVMRRMLSVDFFHNIAFMTTSDQWMTVLRYHSEYTLQTLWDDDPCPGVTYCRASFNAFGDIDARFNISTAEFSQTLAAGIAKVDSNTYNQRLNYNAINVLNDFTRSVRERNASAFLVFPALPDAVMDVSMDGLQEIVGNIEQQVDSVILNEPTGYPGSFFLDTIYHLNNEGREAHTAAITELLLVELNP